MKDYVFGRTIAVVLYTLIDNPETVGKVALFDPSSEKVFLYNGRKDKKTKNYCFVDYSGKSLITGDGSQFFDGRTKTIVTFKKKGQTFNGLVNGHGISFYGTVIGSKVSVSFLRATYTYECRRIGKDLQYE